MDRNKRNNSFRDLSNDLWLRIIHDIEKLKNVYEIGNNLVSFGTIGILRNLALKELINSEIIVEIGSGPGTFLKKLRLFRDKTIIAIDPSPSMIFYSATKFPFVNYLIGLAESIPLRDNSVDLIYCIFSFRDFFNKSNFISEAYRVLRENGKLVIVDTNNTGKLVTRIFLLYIKAIGKLYSLLLNLKNNIFDGLIASIMMLKPVEFYIKDIIRNGFRRVLIRKFLLDNAFMLIAIK